MSKFGNALGVWELKVSGIEFELKPTMKDVRMFRRILLSDQNRKDRNLMFDKFADFMFEMIKTHYNEENDQDIKDWVELNINTLFEEAMIAFRWSTREDLEVARREGLQELKKKMLES